MAFDRSPPAASARPRRRRCALVVLAAALAASCARDDGGGREVRVFAARSLEAAFSRLAAGFERRSPRHDVVLHFAGSQVLAAQLVQGARADVVATADRATMDELRSAGLVAEPRVFARSRLVVVVPAANPAGIEHPRDLARPGVKVVLAGERVPVGRYARAALEELAVLDHVARNVVSREDSVAGVLAKVALGEADAGIAYVTDVQDAGGLRAIPFPPEIDVDVRYALAATTGEADSAQGAAAAFVAYVLSPEGLAALRATGFEAP